MEPLAEKALHAVEKGELTIMPERFEKVCRVIMKTSFCLQYRQTVSSVFTLWLPLSSTSYIQYSTVRGFTTLLFFCLATLYGTSFAFIYLWGPKKKSFNLVPFWHLCNTHVPAIVSWIIIFTMHWKLFFFPFLLTTDLQSLAIKY